MQLHQGSMRSHMKEQSRYCKWLRNKLTPRLKHSTCVCVCVSKNILYQNRSYQYSTMPNNQNENNTKGSSLLHNIKPGQYHQHNQSQATITNKSPPSITHRRFHYFHTPEQCRFLGQNNTLSDFRCFDANLLKIVGQLFHH